jgi:hypothetical protein
MSTLEKAANTAIFERQLSFNRAVQFVTRQAGVSTKEAESALRGVMLWYRA